VGKADRPAYLPKWGLPPNALAPAHVNEKWGREGRGTTSARRPREKEKKRWVRSAA